MLSILESHLDTVHITPAMLEIDVDHPTKETGLFVRDLSDEEIIQKVSKLTKEKLLIEKTPSHVFALSRIKNIFPNSRIILIEREPTDVLFSMIQENKFWQDSPKSLIEAIDLYKKFDNAVNSFKDFDFKIKYEKLWNNPIKEISKLFRFLGLDDTNISDIVSTTSNGKSLPRSLQSVFRKGSPGQGNIFFSKQQIKLIKNRLSNKSLKIIITNHHMTGFTGSENLTITLAKQLKIRGHEVTIYSKFINDVHTSLVVDGIKIVNNLAKISDQIFDVAHVHHNISAYEVRHFFPAVPIVFYSQGILPYLEQPPEINCNISKYLAISEEVVNNLLEKGIQRSEIEIVRNFIDADKFATKTNEIIKSEPAKALIISRNIDENKEQVIKEACFVTNIDVEFIGGRFGEVDQLSLKKKIEESEIIFSLGRGAIEAMFLGKAVIVFDYLGGDGMVSSENFKEICKNNFSGRRYKKNFTVEQVIEEIKKYNSNEIAKIREIVKRDYSSFNVVNKLEEVYKNVIKNFDIYNTKFDHSGVANYYNVIKETARAASDFAFQKGKNTEIDYFVNQLIIIAEKLIEQDNVCEANNILKICLNKSPNNIDVLNDLSVTEILAGNNNLALQYIIKVLEQNQTNEIALSNLEYLNSVIPIEKNTMQKIFVN